LVIKRKWLGRILGLPSRLLNSKWPTYSTFSTDPSPLPHEATNASPLSHYPTFHTHVVHCMRPSESKSLSLLYIMEIPLSLLLQFPFTTSHTKHFGSIHRANCIQYGGPTSIQSASPWFYC
ncbi:unnamed protein product, partial [Linum tenue]